MLIILIVLSRPFLFSIYKDISLDFPSLFQIDINFFKNINPNTSHTHTQYSRGKRGAVTSDVSATPLSHSEGKLVDFHIGLPKTPFIRIPKRGERFDWLISIYNFVTFSKTLNLNQDYIKL